MLRVVSLEQSTTLNKTRRPIPFSRGDTLASYYPLGTRDHLVTYQTITVIAPGE